MIRNIQTSYYSRVQKRPIKNNLAGSVLAAVKQVNGHMYEDTYDAFCAIIFDRETGELFSVIKRDLHGCIHNLFEGQAKIPRCIMLAEEEE